jgi:catechol 2,3-dioxygenase-like lactoylglutathione lyase family enzyme
MQSCELPALEDQRSPPSYELSPLLLEWHLSDTLGVQVWAEPDRAGRSCVVLDESDLDTFVTHLDEAGITHQGPQDASLSRILPLLDPDGNRVVVTGAFTPRV